MQQGFTERDWKLFRSKIADWQEAYIDRLNQEYMELLEEDINPADKFWRLEKRIRNDKKKTGVQVDMRRSMLIFNITSLIYEGAIRLEDLEEFSEELKETVRLYMRIS